MVFCNIEPKTVITDEISSLINVYIVKVQLDCSAIAH